MALREIIRRKGIRPDAGLEQDLLGWVRQALAAEFCAALGVTEEAAESLLNEAAATGMAPALEDLTGPEPAVPALVATA